MLNVYIAQQYPDNSGIQEIYVYMRFSICFSPVYTRYLQKDMHLQKKSEKVFSTRPVFSA